MGNIQIAKPCNEIILMVGTGVHFSSLPSLFQSVHIQEAPVRYKELLMVLLHFSEVSVSTGY